MPPNAPPQTEHFAKPVSMYGDAPSGLLSRGRTARSWPFSSRGRREAALPDERAPDARDHRTRSAARAPLDAPDFSFLSERN